MIDTLLPASCLFAVHMHAAKAAGKLARVAHLPPFVRQTSWMLAGQGSLNPSCAVSTLIAR